jgi:Sec-independent protein translocase protein TatA
MFGNVEFHAGPTEWFVLGFILVKLALLVVIGIMLVRKFPSAMRALGRGVGAFQRGVDEGRRGQ